MGNESHYVFGDVEKVVAEGNNLHVYIAGVPEPWEFGRDDDFDFNEDSGFLIVRRGPTDEDNNNNADVPESVFHLNADERKRANVEELPGSLDEALHLTEKSALVREALGDHVFDKFLENKRIEWDQFRVRVTHYEIERYLPML